MLYDTVLLRTFVAICNSGSFTKAAREVNLTQSAVSLHVKRLEQQVGSRLIVRNARSVRLDRAGRDPVVLYSAHPCPVPGGQTTACGRDSGGRHSDRRAGIFRPPHPVVLAWAILQFVTRPSVSRSSSASGPTSRRWSTRASSIFAIVSHEIKEGDGARCAASDACGRPDGRCSSRPGRAGRAGALSAVLPLAAASLWRSSIGPAGRGRSCCKAPAPPASLPRSRPVSRFRSFLEFNLPGDPQVAGARRGSAAAARLRIRAAAQRNASPAADHLAEMIVNFFQLSTALRPDHALNYQQRSHLLLRTSLDT